jgi:hypothetical protein
MTDDLVKRLQELRSNQYADPSTAPEFVFLDPDLPPSEWEKQYSMDVVYVRADRIEALNEQLEAARADAKEAEAYAEGLEREVKQWHVDCEDFRRDTKAAKAKLAKAVEGLTFYADFHENPNDGPWGVSSQDFGKNARATLAEIEGGKG